MSICVCVCVCVFTCMFICVQTQMRDTEKKRALEQEAREYLCACVYVCVCVFIYDVIEKEAHEYLCDFKISCVCVCVCLYALISTMIVFFLAQKKTILIPNAENKDRSGVLWLRNLNLSFFYGEKKRQSLWKSEYDVIEQEACEDLYVCVCVCMYIYVYMEKKRALEQEAREYLAFAERYYNVCVCVHVYVCLYVCKYM